jgi:hypothetical protein
LRAGLFLTPTGVPASCSAFTPLSYLELAAILLKAAAATSLSQAEEWLLSSYLKSLGASLLRHQFHVAHEGEDEQ